MHDNVRQFCWIGGEACSQGIDVRQLPIVETGGELIGQFLLATALVGDGEEFDHDAARARTEEIMDICDCYMIGEPPVAFASLQDAGDYMLVRHFAVDAAERGKGTGRAAFEALEARAFPGRNSRLYASIDVPGPKAFWEKMGYGAFGYMMERKGVCA